MAAAASAPALPAAARTAAPAAAHPLMSPAATPALGSPALCVGGVQAGAPTGALEATHALEERRGGGSGTQKFVYQKCPNQYFLS